MNVTSLTFLIFCAITILTYFIVPKKCQWVVLLISSIIFLFYDNFHISTVLQALIVLIPSYFIGLKIEKNINTKKAKKFLILGILIIIAQLIYLRYSNLFVETANYICKLFGNDYQFEYIQRNSLIGISYYSLIMISYLVDIYRGGCKAQKNIFKCALFMSYFPILSSGPFIRYEDTGKKLFEKHKFSYDRMCRGLVRILWGLFKILVISDRIAIIVDAILGNVIDFNAIFTAFAVLLFPLQLFTNFSGSIDVIMGISEILGINLPENFTLPFFSKTITEFWRNWHITLGAWLRDYVFYPLQKSDDVQELTKKCKAKFGKKIGKKIPMFMSMLIMWIIIGIWHGGDYKYIIGSGLLQFIFILLEDLLEPLAEKVTKKLGIKRDVFSYKLYQVIRTYLLFSFAMIFFRADNMSNAIYTIKNIFNLNLSLLLNKDLLISMIKGMQIDIYDLIVLIISLIVMFIVGLLARKKDVREKIFEQNIVFRWGLIYILIFSIIIFGCYGAGYNPTEFIYKQF